MQDANQNDAVLDGQPWRTQLEELERTLQEVGRAIVSLRQALEASDSSVEPPALRVVEPDSGAAELDDPQVSALEHEQPVEDVVQASTAEHTVVAPKPQPTEFQKVWERHKEESAKGVVSADAVDAPEGGDSVGPEAAGPLDPKADKESSPGTEDEASAVTGYQEVWARLRKEQKTAGPEERGDAEASPAEIPGVPGKGPGNFDRVWERLNREREGRSEEGAESKPEPRGLEGLLKEYRMTIEDRDGTPVDLVPLHRALMVFASSDDISLAGYAKGTAIVGLRTEGELDLDRLASVIGAATMRHCEVIPQDQGKLFLRLSDEEEDDG